MSQAKLNATCLTVQVNDTTRSIKRHANVSTRRTNGIQPTTAIKKTLRHQFVILSKDLIASATGSTSTCTTMDSVQTVLRAQMTIRLDLTIFVHQAIHTMQICVGVPKQTHATICVHHLNSSIHLNVVNVSLNANMLSYTNMDEELIVRLILVMSKMLSQTAHLNSLTIKNFVNVSLVSCARNHVLALSFLVQLNVVLASHKKNTTHS